MQSDRRKNDFLDPFLSTFYWLLKKPPSLYQNAKRVLCNPESSREPVFKSFSCFICQLFTGILSHLVLSVSCLPAYGHILFHLSVVYRHMVASCFNCQLFTGIWSHQPMLQREDFVTNKKKRHFLIVKSCVFSGAGT